MSTCKEPQALLATSIYLFLQKLKLFVVVDFAVVVVVVGMCVCVHVSACVHVYLLCWEGAYRHTGVEGRDNLGVDFSGPVVF